MPAPDDDHCSTGDVSPARAMAGATTPGGGVPGGQQPGCLERVAGAVDSAVSNAFAASTAAIVEWPKATLGAVGIITIILANGVWFFEENYSEDAYAPEQSRSKDERDWVYRRFEDDPRLGMVYFVADGDSILTKRGLGAMMDYHSYITNELTAEHGGAPVDFQVACDRHGDAAACAPPSGILRLWDFNATQLAEDPDVLATLNAPGAWREVSPGGADLESFLSEVRRADDGRILGAKATYMDFYFKNEKDPVRRVDFVTEAFERSLSESTYGVMFDAAKAKGVEVYAWTNAEKERADSEAIDAELPLLVVGYMLMIVFATLVLTSGRAKYSQGSLALCSVLSIMMSTISAYGLCWYLGIKFNGIVQVLILVLLGLGIDDTFVIMNDWRELSHVSDAKERMIRAMRHAGPAITLTSMTDVVAFLAGSSSSLPALADFCYYASIGIFIDFSYQVTFFVACAYLQSKRQADNRADCLCCVKVEDDTPMCGAGCLVDTSRPYDEAAPTWGKRLWGVHYARAVLSNPGRMLVLVVSLLFVGLGAWGCTRLKMNLDTEWFVADGHPLRKTFEVRSRYFGGSRLPLGIWTEETIDYPDEQGLLYDVMLRRVETIDLVVKDSQSCWLFDFVEWANTTAPDAVSTNTTADADASHPMVDPTRFYPLLRNFTNYDIAPAKYHQHIPRIAWNANKTRIEATQCVVLIQDAPMRDGQLAIDMIREFRATLDGTRTFAFSLYFVFWEGYGVMMDEMVRNVLITASCVFVISTLFTANLLLGVFVMINIACIDVCLLGWMNLLGVEVNSVSVICVVLAVGLAVDYSVHIANSFVHAKATATATFSARKQRAAYSLWKMGSAVALGGFSTFLAVAPLVAGKSYVFKVFFRMFAVIIFFGLWFGMVFLPVVFSFIGPEPNVNAVDLDEHPEDMPLHDDSVLAAHSPRAVAPSCPDVVQKVPSAPHLQGGAY